MPTTASAGLSSFLAGFTNNFSITWLNPQPNFSSNLSFNFLGNQAISCGIAWIAGCTKSDNGSKIFLSIDSRILTLKSLAASFNGWKASATVPKTPPWRIPLIFLPRSPSLKSSVDAIIPIAEPTIALPIIPNGPPNNVDTIPTPAPLSAPGSILRIISFSLSPILSLPKSFSLISSFCFNIPKAEPIIMPPTGPNGVIREATRPRVPNLVTSGAYFFTVSWIEVLINPSFLRLPSLPIEPNMIFLIASEFLSSIAPAPTAAPTSGPPTNPRSNDVPVPTVAPASISGT